MVLSLPFENGVKLLSLYKVKTKTFHLKGHLGKMGTIYYINRGQGNPGSCICDVSLWL